MKTTLSNEFHQMTTHSPLLSTFVLVEDDSVVLETRDARRMRREIKSRGLRAPDEMSNRLQQWTISLDSL